MYNVILNVIKSKNYELADMLTKINTLWVQGVKNGGITDEEKEELIALARENAEVHQSIDVMEKLEDHEKRLAELEELVKNLTASKEESEGGEEVTEESYEEYVSGRWCKNGDIFTFEGKVVKCIAPEGVTCVWSPNDYPAYWEVYMENTPEEEPEEETE